MNMSGHWHRWVSVNELKQFITKPFVLALLLLLGVLPFLPKTQKYRINEVSRTSCNTPDYTIHYYYADLDGDGETELIGSGLNTRKEHAIIIKKLNGTNIDQWNFSGSPPPLSTRFFTRDADSNGFTEIYLFSQIVDSLFLHCFEPLKKGGLYIEKIFIDTIRRVDEITDYFLLGIGFHPLGPDKQTAFVFSVNAGHSIYPRKAYAFNPITRQVMHSMHGGWQVGQHFSGKTIHGSSYFLNTVFAPGNYKDNETSPFTDHSAWLIVWDHKLHPLFPPKEYPGFNRSVCVVPFTLNPGDDLMVYSLSSVECDSCFKLERINLKGQVLKSRLLESRFKYPNTLIPPGLLNNTHPLLVRPGDGSLFEVDTTLNLKLFGKTGPGLYFTNHMNLSFDLTQHGLEQFVLVYSDEGFHVLSRNLKHQMKVILTNGPIRHASLRYGKELPKPQIAVQTSNHLIHYDISLNSFFYWRWPIMLMVYLFLSILFAWSRKVYAEQLMRYTAIERDLAEYQFKTLTNQLDPHFTFNILNSIGSSIMMEDKNTAYNQLVQFSRLMRQSLEDSDAIGRSIEKETALLENYLSLQKESHPNSFEYQLQISPEVDGSWQIPKLILQSFAENALKHGLYPSSKKGNLRVSIQTDKKFLTIEIEDNGIGRKQAAKQNNYSTQKGISLFNRLAELANRKKKDLFSIQINDLYDAEQNARGTLVIIRLPAQHKFGLHEN